MCDIYVIKKKDTCEYMFGSYLERQWWLWSPLEKETETECQEWKGELYVYMNRYM